jgi:hypothetical protein
VLAVTVPDVLESLQLTRKRGKPQAAKRIRKAVTINRSREEVELALAGADELRARIEEEGATVHFAPAPGGRGTELMVEWAARPPLGELGAAARKLSGRDLATELADDLRRLKQLIETGEIVRSDAVPEGHLLARHLRQRAAQPLEEALR